MDNSLDVPMIDDELLTEMQLLVALIITTNSTPHRLSTQEIDAALGLGQAPPHLTIGDAAPRSETPHSP